MFKPSHILQAHVVAFFNGKYLFWRHISLQISHPPKRIDLNVKCRRRKNQKIFPLYTPATQNPDNTRKNHLYFNNMRTIFADTWGYSVWGAQLITAATSNWRRRAYKNICIFKKPFVGVDSW